MKALVRYTAVTGLMALAVLVMSWALLDGVERRSVAVAAAVAFPAQVGLFALLARARADAMKFMGWWAAGVMSRMVLLAALGLSVRSFGGLDPSATLLPAAGLFFVFLMLEPVFLPELDHEVSTTG